MLLRVEGLLLGELTLHQGDRLRLHVCSILPGPARQAFGLFPWPLTTRPHAHSGAPPVGSASLGAVEVVATTGFLPGPRLLCVNIHGHAARHGHGRHGRTFTRLPRALLQARLPPTRGLPHAALRSYLHASRPWRHCRRLATALSAPRHRRHPGRISLLWAVILYD